MPRPILGAKSAVNLGENSAAKSLLGPAEVRARLQAPRSERYINAVKTMLDAGGHVPLDHSEHTSLTNDQHRIDEFVSIMHAEFPDLSPSDLPMGIVAECFLGKPYEVHTLNAGYGIVHHYRRGEPMPDALERARTLALHPDYAFIEVYGNELRAIRVTRNPVLIAIAIGFALFGLGGGL